jgi:tetratricopeptide (TPR) repeat protein
MSPEQARGDPDLDARSDIYSLGSTLYEALTDVTAYRGAPHLVLRQVIEEDPRPLRQLNDRIPRDLETICLKAMARERARRYQTAGELADDLGRFLRGETILARPAGVVERTWRWCRNNQRVAVLIALVTLLLLTLTVGSIVAAVSIYRERSVAIASARRADTQRGLAVDALSSLVQGIQDQLATRPGTLELRRSLLETARDGLSKVSSSDSSGSNQGEVDHRTIQALLRLGDIDYTLGRAAESRSEFEQAATLAERVSQTDPQSALIRRELASAYDRVGDQISHTYSDKLVPQQAEYCEKAYAIRLALVAEHPDNSVYRRDLRVSQDKLGGVRFKAGRIDEAAKLYEDSLRALKAEPVDDKNRTVILSDLRLVQGRLAGIAASRGRAAEAIAMNREALASAKALCAIDPQNVSYLRQLGFALDYLGMACLDFGELDEAERWLTAFRDNRQAAVDADPADQDARRSLAFAYQNLGDVAERRRDFDTARAAYHQAVTRMEEIARRDSKSVMAFRDLTVALLKMLQLEAGAGRHAAAAAWADREVEVLTAKGVPPYPEHAEAVAEATLLRDVYRLIDQCVDHPALARRQEPSVAGRLLCVRALVLARAGRSTEVVEAAQELLKLPKMPPAPFAPSVPFYAAHACAIAAKSAGKSRPEVRAECIRMAVRALRQAPASATANDDVQPPLLPYLPDFEALRDDPDFITLTRPTSPGGPKPEGATTAH